mgnify:CR=1 FL=1
MMADYTLSDWQKESLYKNFEKLRDEKGAFLAASSEDYHACWMRDQLYANFAYYFLGEHEKFKIGIRVVFDMLHNARAKIEQVVTHPPQNITEYIHAKYSHDTLMEITNDWGHHQVDAVGQFLWMVAFAEKNGVPVVETEDDRQMLQLIIQYLIAVKYWEYPDNGMWEEWMELHTSSLGAAVAGLRLAKEVGLAVIPESMIAAGNATLFTILPNETPLREQDLAQLSLMWPYELVSFADEDAILERIERELIQERGVNRYLDDNYYRSDNGVSAEWCFGFFWLSLVYIRRSDREKALYWFERGMSTMTPEGDLPELYLNGAPNPNTPLAWTHSLALIAAKKLNLL